MTPKEYRIKVREFIAKHGLLYKFRIVNSFLREYYSTKTPNTRSVYDSIYDHKSIHFSIKDKYYHIRFNAKNHSITGFNEYAYNPNNKAVMYSRSYSFDNFIIKKHGKQSLQFLQRLLLTEV